MSSWSAPVQGILLDRDGVINYERTDYVKTWEEFELLSGALRALRLLATLHVPIAVVTNQSAIGRGLTTVCAVGDIHERLAQLVCASGGRIDAFFVCPHTPQAGCSCRKPRPGLLIQAAEQLGIALSSCVLIGDSVTDYQAATAAGCAAILVRSGRQGSHLQRLLKGESQVIIREDLESAAHQILMSVSHA